MRQVSFTLLISLIMRLQSKSVREEHFVHILGEVLSCEASIANLPPVGIRLNASKSESMLAKQ